MGFIYIFMPFYALLCMNLSYMWELSLCTLIYSINHEWCKRFQIKRMIRKNEMFQCTRAWYMYEIAKMFGKLDYQTMCSCQSFQGWRMSWLMGSHVLSKGEHLAYMFFLSENISHSSRHIGTEQMHILVNGITCSFLGRTSRIHQGVSAVNYHQGII